MTVQELRESLSGCNDNAIVYVVVKGTREYVLLHDENVYQANAGDVVTLEIEVK